MLDPRDSSREIAGKTEQDGRLALSDPATVGGLSLGVRAVLPLSSGRTIRLQSFDHEQIVEPNSDVTLRNAAHPAGVSCKGVYPWTGATSPRSIYRKTKLSLGNS